MHDETRPTRTSPGGDAGTPRSSFPSIHEGRFPAGTTLAGRFRILGLLGQGGMGEVYRALDLTLNQPVALKFIALDSRRDEAALARFRNEVRIARQVSHPNVCRVYDIGVIEGQHFLSMEYVDGEDLASLLRRIGRLPSDKALEFTRRICAGLAAAHERGVLHRDLKPANIMIDGRGHVRITDFGLAALAGDVHGGEIRSGTPAYMSPEQKAGKEVTTRSDIYSLGLVLHEMFTGKRPDHSQSTPTSLVKDLDPAIERVILRCLEADPRHRPSSALSVAMALPGGDPIAAALAAGETPSPEMVAASGEKEGLEPRTAVACFAGVLVLWVALVLISSKTTLLGRAPLPIPPDALAFKAREMLRQFGYTEEPVDSAYGFYSSASIEPYGRYLRAKDLDHQWERVASHQPALLGFWYRQHQDYLRPYDFLPGDYLINGFVTLDDPPLVARGMIRILLNANGRLERLDALSSPAPSDSPEGRGLAGRTADWTSLLSAAGLDAARFTPATPEAFMSLYADSRMAWTGKYDESRPDTIRVEAAALGGRPVFFRIFGPWQEPEITTALPRQRFVGVFLEVMFVSMLIAAGLVAWRNVRLGRGDKSAAWRVAGVVFAAGVGTWVCVASHMPTLFELYLLVNGLSWAAFQATFVGVLYLAVEPFVRKYWPDALISWLRIVGGRIRDPLTMSHVLVGIANGLAVAMFQATTVWATNGLTHQPAVALALSGARFLLGNYLTGLRFTPFAAMGSVLVLILLRSVVRRNWLADVLFVVLLFPLPFGLSPAAIPAGVLLFATSVWLLRRFGLLALIASGFAGGSTQNVPISGASWYTALSWTTPALIAAVAAWALYVILSTAGGSTSRSASVAS